MGYILMLNRRGSLTKVEDLTGKDADGKRQVPERVGRTSGAPAANLLWDNTEYALGYGDKPPAKCMPRLAAFRRRLDDLPEALRADAGVAAVIAFLRDHDPKTFPGSRLGQQIEDLTRPVTFALEDDDEELVCQRDAVVAHVAGLAPSGPEITCAITGERDHLAVLHPSFQGVPGGGSTGAYLVSFNTATVNHFGREQGANAAIGVRATAAYSRTLDYLLATPAHRVRIGEHVILAWADDVDAGKSFVPAMFDAREDDIEDASEVRAIYRAPWNAVSPDDLDREFYILGLTGVKGRVAVSMWQEGRLQDVARRCREWFDDLALAGRSPHARGDGRRITDVVRALAPSGRNGKVDYDKLPGRDAATLLRAALTGGPIPGSFAAKALLRLKHGGYPDDDHTRTALLKAFLIRSTGMALAPNLDRTRTEIGYLLGRLLAVVEHAQQVSSFGKAANATVRDRFWGMLSTTPVRALPILDWMFVVYLKRARGKAAWLEQEIAQIRGLMRTVGPTLPFGEQALFGIGYSQQRTELWTSHARPNQRGSVAETDPETATTQAEQE